MSPSVFSATACFVIVKLFVLLCLAQIVIMSHFRENERNLILDFYKHYKYYHFYSICFGIGCGMALYRPFRSLLLPAVPAVFFTILFEVVGICFDLPAYTATCKGPPYDRRDFYWGFCFALFVAILNLNSYHVYTLSYGCGIIVFALRGAQRKCSALRKLRERQWPRC